jgi:hypothetical protein
MRSVSTPCLNSADTLAVSSSFDNVNTRRKRGHAHLGVARLHAFRHRDAHVAFDRQRVGFDVEPSLSLGRPEGRRAA